MTATPPWTIAHWLNTPAPLSLEALRGKIIFAIAFQMLCPGCASNGIPQALKVRALFPEDQLAVIGLHTVFEHHAAQGTPVALEAFLHEYKIRFPVGIDARGEGPLPVTMSAYGLRGTPTTLIYDRSGRLRAHQFGHFEDMQLGAILTSLLGESFATP